MDAAERLFGACGFAGTSLRSITSEAGVNVAAVNYHFRSKEELLRAVLARIVAPVNRERLDLLDRAEAEAAPAPPGVERILQAFIEPDLHAIRDLGERGVIITRFIARSYTEPSDLVRRMMEEQFGELGNRFHRALCGALPNIPPDELYWRLIAVVALITQMLGPPASGGPFDDLLDPQDIDKTLNRMIGFLEPAISAPATG